MDVLRRALKSCAWYDESGRMKFNLLAFSVVAMCVPVEIYRWYLPAGPTDDVGPHCGAYDVTRCADGGPVDKTETGLTCTNTDQPYAQSPSYPVTISWLTRVFDDVDVNLRTGRPAMWWSFLPFTSDLRLRAVYGFHRNNVKRMGMFTDVHKRRYDSGSEKNMARILLPTRPLECTGSYKNLPSLALLNSKIVQRKPGRFEPDPIRRNVLVDAFYQYFVLQFFDADFNLTVTASQLYGTDEATKKELRSFSDGKLKTERVNNEDYPPSLSFAERVKTILFPASAASKSNWHNGMTNGAPKWAVGHPLVNASPTLFAMAALWVREHNRVCDLLRRQWPAWTDGQLFDTAGRVIVGEMMAIVMNEVLNARAGHSLSLRHRPEVLHGRPADTGGSATPIELLLTAMWPSGGTAFSGNNRQVIANGIGETVRRMVDGEFGTTAGGGDATEPMAGLLLRLSRENAVQGFNGYRRRLGLYPYASFYGLTGDRETARTLESLYGHVDRVELLAGMLTEKTGRGALPTVTVMANSLVVNSILTNPLAGERAWNAATFGGTVGFDAVRSATVATFVCNNLADGCDGRRTTLYPRAL